jgi:hypothetical protein
MSPRLVDVTAAADAASWDRVARAALGSTIYHTRAWAQACADALPASTAVARLYRFDDGDEVLVPGVVTRVLGGSGRCFRSSPPFDYGGPVSAQRLDSEKVASIAQDLRSAGYASVDVYESPYAISPALDGFSVTPQWTHSIPLDGGFDHVWMSRFSKNARRFARHAEKSGVVIREATERSDVGELYRLYLLSAERWGEKLTWLRPRELCEAAFDMGPDRARLWLAEHEGEVVAASMDYLHSSMCFAGWRAFDDSYSALKVNYALLANSVRHAAERGCEYYDLGASSGLEGVEEFKQRCGAVAMGYRAWSWQHPAYAAVARGRRSLTDAARKVRSLAHR